MKKSEILAGLAILFFTLAVNPRAQLKNEPPSAINSHNTFEKADIVRTTSFTGARIKNNQMSLTMPAKSIIILEV